LPVPASHRRSVWSAPKESTSRPSGEKVAPSACPSIRRTSLPVASSHSRTVLSALPDRAKRPSGETATER
jgi:hypothetical protein